MSYLILYVDSKERTLHDLEALLGTASQGYSKGDPKRGKLKGDYDHTSWALQYNLPDTVLETIEEVSNTIEAIPRELAEKVSKLVDQGDSASLYLVQTIVTSDEGFLRLGIGLSRKAVAWLYLAKCSFEVDQYIHDD